MVVACLCLVHPTTGNTYWWIVPFLNSKVFSQVLADFAEHFGVGKHKRVILALDQAAFHRARKGASTRGGSFVVSAPEVPRVTAC